MWRCFCLFSCFVYGFSGFVVAQEQEPAAPTPATMEQLLTVGWKFNPDNMASAIEMYRELKTVKPDDLNLQHAMALVAFRQQKHAEAKQLLRTTIEKSPNSVTLRETELWLLVVTKDYDTLLQTITNLGIDFKDPQRALAIKSVAGFSGNLIGYLQGPLGKTLPKTMTAQRITTFEEQLLKNWPTELAQLYSQQKQATLEKYQTAKAKFDANRGEVATQQSQDRASELEKNKADQADTSKQLTDTQAAADKLKGEYEKVRDQLAISLQAAQNQYQTLQGQYNQSLAQALNLRAEAKNYRAQGADPKNKNKNLDALARNADDQASRLEATCRALEQRSVPVKAQVVSLTNELRKRTAAFENEYKALDQEYRKLELTVKKLVNQQKDLEKPATGLNAETNKELAKLDDIENYVPFSIEEVRMNLLRQGK
jgi:hypothetical protein